MPPYRVAKELVKPARNTNNGVQKVKRGYGGFIRDVVAHYPRAVSWDVSNRSLM